MQNDFINKLNAYSVLYAEDEDGIRNNIKEILEHLFKEVTCTKNASEAYIKYLENNPDLIITDIKMGNETGLDLVKKALEQEPSNIAYLDTLAWGEYKAKNCKEAYYWMKQIVDEVGLEDSEIKLHWEKIQECKK